jgi:ATP-dependent RNA helicase DHX30
VDTSLTPPPTPSRPAASVPSLPVSVPISDALSSPQPSPQAQAALPVDAHRERILQHVRQYPVTIINGMTGCGKSTRIPVMLLEDSRENGTPEKRAEDSTENRGRGGAKDSDAYIMVSQPRRIAATALKNRLAQTLGDAVGLRLGKGRREEVSTFEVCFKLPRFICCVVLW